MKIIQHHKLSYRIRELCQPDQKLLVAHGVYDRLHMGHMLQLMRIKEMYPDDFLLVTITDDKHVRENKGMGRPYCDEITRAKALSGLSVVDAVCVIPENDALGVIRAVKPDRYIKGTEYANKSHTDDALKAELELVVSFGGKVSFISSEIPTMSTSLMGAAGENDRAYAFLQDFIRLSDRERLLRILSKMSELRVMVAGDAIVDRSTFIQMGNKAPKTCILTLEHIRGIHNTITSLGGALFMANTAAQFVKEVSLFTAIGTRPFICDYNIKTEELLDRLAKNVVKNIAYLPDRCPTIKWRFKECIFPENSVRQTITQLNFVSHDPYPQAAVDEMLDCIKPHIPRQDVIIMADFGHGYCESQVYHAMAQSDKFVAAMTQANGFNYGLNTIWKVPRASFLCIDDVELRLALGDTSNKVERLANVVMGTKRFDNVAITQGKRGCLMVTPNSHVRVPSIQANIIDRIGAGDTFMVVVTLALYCGATPSEAGLLGNVGGALACAVQSNTAPVTTEQIAESIGRLFR